MSNPAKAMLVTALFALGLWIGQAIADPDGPPDAVFWITGAAALYFAIAGVSFEVGRRSVR